MTDNLQEMSHNSRNAQAESNSRPRAGAVVAVVLLLSALMPIERALGAEFDVRMRLTRFLPEELRIDPGDRVTWMNEEQQLHDIRSDERGQFGSGDLGFEDTFSHRFDSEGYFYYYCSIHGAPGGVGMSGVVVVGDPPPPPPPDTGGGKRKRIVVPRDYATITQAVDNAPRGAKIVVKPGTYDESVLIEKSGITLKGVDRFRTVITGGDELQNGITVNGTEDVEIRNLTVRNFRRAGVFINDTEGYLVHKVDSIKNRTFGIYAFDSYEGVIRRSYAFGSGDSAFYVGQCLSCSALIHDVRAEESFFGYSGTNATGVVISDSVFEDNAAGIVPNSFPWEAFEPNRGTTILNNIVRNNNYRSVPQSGMSRVYGMPFGVGIWLWGAQNSEVIGNTVTGHDGYGILVTPSHNEEHLAVNNRIKNNTVIGSQLGDLAIDGGTNNCLADNQLTGSTLPADAPEAYACDSRPIANADLTEFRDQLFRDVRSRSRVEAEPPDPKRPRCQKGKPGCKRK